MGQLDFGPLPQLLGKEREGSHSRIGLKDHDSSNFNRQMLHSEIFYEKLIITKYTSTGNRDKTALLCHIRRPCLPSLLI